MSELIIKISAEAKEFEDTVKDIKKQTESLETQLASIAKISGAAFAGLTAAAGLSLKAFAESEKASKELTVALQNQGIASNELVDRYKNLASEIQKKTGIDDDAIVKGEAILQNFLGQTEVSEDLANALANLSEKTGSVESAAEILGRGIAGNTRGLKQFGITIDENLDKNERLAKILEQVNQKFNGLAESGNKGLGSFRGLKAASSDFLENVGERLAPAVTSVVVALTNFFNKLNENGPLIDFIVETGKIAAIVTGVVTALATAGIALLKLQQAFAIAQTAVTAFGLASKVAVGATGIGLLLIVAAEIYANWNKIFPVIQAVYVTFANNIAKISEGLGDILLGVFSFSPSKAKDGINKLKSVLVEGFDNIKKAVPAEGELSLAKAVTSTPAQIAAAKAASDKIAQQDKDRSDRIQAENELILLTLNNASQATIDLKKKEIETLKLFEDEKYASQRETLIAQLEQISLLQEEQAAIDLEKQKTFDELRLLQQVDFQAKTEAQRNVFLERNKQKLLEQIKTEKDIRDAAILEDQKARIDTNNKKLAEQIKYGSAYASINAVITSQEVQNTKGAADQLVQLQNSKNSTLKSIGKAAALSQIAIDTARGAMAAYASLQYIPFIGPFLGAAAAAAVIAYGAERTANVISAQEGGIIPGMNKGGDSVSSFLQPGELVVPRSNFDEVVNSVAAQRASASQSLTGTASGDGGPVSGSVMVDLRFSGDNAEKFLTARQVEAKSLGTLREATV
jgi:hypothetical protein